jgi:hypothetical protein
MGLSAGLKYRSSAVRLLVLMCYIRRYRVRRKMTSGRGCEASAKLQADEGGIPEVIVGGVVMACRAGSLHRDSIKEV